MGCNPSAEQSQSLAPKIAFLGLDASGKSTIVHHIISNSMTEEYVPVSTANVEFFESFHNSVKFQIYDCGGFGRYREQWLFYVKQSNAVCFVIDKSDKERMSVVREEIRPILIECKNKEIPILILINKSDKRSNLTIDDFKLITNIIEYNVNYTIKECSGLSGDGIMPALDWLLQQRADPLDNN